MSKIFILILLHVSFSSITLSRMVAEETKLPTVEIEEAIELARKHLSKQGVDLSRHKLTGARWVQIQQAVGTSKVWCWGLDWLTKEQLNQLEKQKNAKMNMRGGGYLNVLVLEDRSIEYSFTR